jgi:hypothetical protein
MLCLCLCLCSRLSTLAASPPAQTMPLLSEKNAQHLDYGTSV